MIQPRLWTTSDLIELGLPLSQRPTFPVCALLRKLLLTSFTILHLLAFNHLKSIRFLLSSLVIDFYIYLQTYSQLSRTKWTWCSLSRVRNSCWKRFQHWFIGCVSHRDSRFESYVHCSQWTRRCCRASQKAARRFGSFLDISYPAIHLTIFYFSLGSCLGGSRLHGN